MKVASVADPAANAAMVKMSFDVTTTFPVWIRGLSSIKVIDLNMIVTGEATSAQSTVKMTADRITAFFLC